jgi:hypothetical protein
VDVLSGSEFVQVFLSSVYQCIAVEDPNIKRGFGIPLSDFYVPLLNI